MGPPLRQEPWELFKVDNTGCLDARPAPPLGIPARDAASNPAEQALVAA